MAETRRPTGPPIEVRSLGRDINRYIGPEGEVDFVAFGAMDRGQFVQRGGQIVEAIDAMSFRRPGEGGSRELSPEDRESVLRHLRSYYRDRGIPYQIRHESGEIELETGERQPSFRSALPEVHHSDGWTLTDLYSSPQYPDPIEFPPTVVYQDASGRAELPRDVLTIAGERRRVFRTAGLRWLDDRADEPMGDEDRTLILSRIRSVYDHWGIRYEIDDEDRG